MKISGKGMPVYNQSNFGDLYVTLKIQIPETVSQEEKRLLEEIKNLTNKN